MADIMSFGHSANRWGFQRKEPKFRSVGSQQVLIIELRTGEGERLSRNPNHGNRWVKHPCECEVCKERGKRNGG